ncbi:PREDICTED: lachrymatory-factor synthase-like [Ipomoea nil]|uniref:lachrymatory-factor synthase-like n=1 Tax=Ipomoea nil TaxID=35883 RepID=UPI0009019B39|nr:PREDICTED: lachrymatory-factor synthase-like [Ipomoea nil]
MAAQEESKWEGKATAELKGAKAQKVWETLVEDFCAAHKWLPGIDTCHLVEGAKGEVGAVRYVGSTVPASEEGGEAKVNWCRERLVKVDHGGRSLSYQILDSNVGMKEYVATLTVLAPAAAAAASSDGGDELGCQIEWSYVSDPIVGMTREGFSGYVSFSLQAMAEKMDKELQSAA